MTIGEFKKVARLLKEVYKELQNEAIRDGIDILSQEYNDAINLARLKVLSSSGFTLEEYQEAKAEFEAEIVSKKEEEQKKKETEKSEFAKIFESIPKIKGENGKDGHTPTDEELLKLIKPLIPNVKDGHTPTENELLKLIIPLIPRVKDGETPSEERLLSLIRPLIPSQLPLESKLTTLEKKVDNIKIPQFNPEELKEDLKGYLTASLKENIDMMGMPDFRKLAMGLQEQINNAGTGSGNALTSDPLSQFAATTSAQLAGVITDETGTGFLVYSDSPTLTGSITLSDMTLGSVLFAGTSGVISQDNAGLFYEATNNRLGINVGASPTGHLHITASSSGGAQAFNIDGTVTTASATYQVARWNTTLDPSSAITNFYVNNLDANIGSSGSNNVTTVQAYRGSISATGTWTGTITTANVYHAQNVTAASAGATITTAVGFNCENFSNASVTNKMAFRGQMNAGTSKWNLYIDGTADNYLEGNLLIGESTITTGLPKGWNATNARVVEVRSNGTSGDSGVFINRSDLARGLFLWNDNSAGDAYIENMYDNDAGDIIFRTKGLNASPITVLTMTGLGKSTFRASTTSAATMNIPAGTTPTSPVEGDMWADSTQKTINRFTAGINQAMVGALFTQTASATVANTVTETTIIGSGVGTMTMPVNLFTVGKTLRLTWRGFLSDTGTPTIRIRVKLGSTTIGDTGAIALTGTVTNEEWSVDYILTCRTTGASGTVFGQGDFHFDNSASAGLIFGMPATATSTIDTTATQAVSITVEWGAADAANTITSTNGILEVLN